MIGMKHRELAEIAALVSPSGELADIARQLVSLRGKREDLAAQRKMLADAVASPALGFADDVPRRMGLLRQVDRDIGEVGAEIAELEARERRLKFEYGDSLRDALAERRADALLDAEVAAARFQRAIDLVDEADGVAAGSTVRRSDRAIVAATLGRSLLMRKSG